MDGRRIPEARAATREGRAATPRERLRHASALPVGRGRIHVRFGCIMGTETPLTRDRAARRRQPGDPLAHEIDPACLAPVSYTHLRAHETVLDLVCRLLLE